jgi:hypothetical protein
MRIESIPETTNVISSVIFSLAWTAPGDASQTEVFEITGETEALSPGFSLMSRMTFR